MSSSCRQSARLSKKAKATNALEDLDGLSDLTELDSDHESLAKIMDSDSEVYFDEEEDAYESDLSAYSEVRRRSKTSKRRKTSEGTRKSITSKAYSHQRRIHKSLSMLPNMPLDILFEVLAHLPPADLLSLARTARNFRQLLMTKRAVIVWKSARESLTGPDAPGCPPDLSEPQWANLIWGGNACQECGTRPVLKVTFSIRRRVCTACLKRHLVKKPDFYKKFPSYDEEIMELVPYSNVGGWAHGYESTTRYFWDDDLTSMNEKFKIYKKAIIMHKSNAKRNLDTFKKEMMEAVAGILAQTRRVSEWYDGFTQEQSATVQQIRTQRMEEIKRRLVDEGWPVHDIENVLWSRTITAKPLTDLSWKRVYPGLVRKLEEEKKIREALEFRLVLDRRKFLLEKVYQTFLVTQAPSDALFFPNIDAICEFPAFKKELYYPAEVDVTEDNFSQAMADGQLPSFITEWLREDPRRETLVHAVAAEYTPSPAEGCSPYARVPALATATGSNVNISDVNSAAATFRCISHRCSMRDAMFCGFEEVALHDHQDAMFPSADDQPEMFFDARLAKVVNTLLNALGLPATTTAKDLDARQAWFLCNHCLPRLYIDNTWHKATMTWRQCLNHCRKSHGLEITPSWKLLSEEDLTTVALSDPRDAVRGWYCNHCSHFLSRSPDWQFGHRNHCGTKGEVLAHIDKVHTTQHTPTIDQDFSWHPARSSSESVTMPDIPKKAMALDADVAARSYGCSHCPRKTRLFNFSGAMDHLRMVHRLMSPAEGVDYHY